MMSKQHRGTTEVSNSFIGLGLKNNPASLSLAWYGLAQHVNRWRVRKTETQLDTKRRQNRQRKRDTERRRNTEIQTEKMESEIQTNIVKETETERHQKRDWERYSKMQGKYNRERDSQGCIEYDETTKIAQAQMLIYRQVYRKRERDKHTVTHTERQRQRKIFVGSLVESTPIVRRVVGSTPALAATSKSRSHLHLALRRGTPI